MRAIDADELNKKFTVMDLSGFPVKISSAVVVQAIDAAPTLDVAPAVRGEWVPDSEVAGLYSCSVCHITDHREPKHRLCPNCGAQMTD